MLGRHIMFYNVSFEELGLIEKDTDRLIQILPVSENSAHFLFPTDLRIRYPDKPRQEINDCYAMLTPNYIFFLKRDEELVFVVIDQFHVLDVTLIAYSKDQELLIRKHQANIVLKSGDTLRFAQLLYRNIQIFLSANPLSELPTVKCDDMNLFPFLNIRLSPSQKFQFAYYSLCAKNSVPYHQEAVNFIHTLIRSRSAILDFSQLPLDIFGSSQLALDLLPVFKSLSLMSFVCGICCSNTEQKHVFQQLSTVLENSKRMSIIHVTNCQATSGLEQVRAAFKSNSKLPITYWNISDNHLTDTMPFVEIMKMSKNPISYLNISNCGFTPESVSSLFSVMCRNKNLHNINQLHLSGINFDDSAFSNFDKFLTFSHLSGLSISTTCIERIFESLINHPQPLLSLNLTGCNLKLKQVNSLIFFINQNATLRDISLSDTGIDIEDVARIIEAIDKNKNLLRMQIHLDKLNIHGESVFPIIRAILSSHLSRWSHISLNDNGMDSTDLRNIAPLLALCTRLKSLSLSGNFNEDIGDTLLELLKIKSLEKLTLAGTPQHRIGKGFIPLLSHLRELEKLKILDIHDQEIGSEGVEEVIKLIRTDATIVSYNIDGCKISSPDHFKALADAVEERGHVVYFAFPTKDAAILAERSNRDASRLGQCQMRLVDAVNSHRAMKGMPMQLPFEATKEITQVMHQLTKETSDQLSPSVALVHSGICEEFKLPLPFQREGDIVDNGGKVVLVKNLGEMEAYNTKAIHKIIIENGRDFGGGESEREEVIRQINEEIKAGQFGPSSSAQSVKEEESIPSVHSTSAHEKKTEVNFSSAEQSKKRRRHREEESETKIKRSTKRKGSSDDEHISSGVRKRRVHESSSDDELNSGAFSRRGKKKY